MIMTINMFFFFFVSLKINNHIPIEFSNRFRWLCLGYCCIFNLLKFFPTVSFRKILTSQFKNKQTKKEKKKKAYKIKKINLLSPLLTEFLLYFWGIV